MATNSYNKSTPMRFIGKSGTTTTEGASPPMSVSQDIAWTDSISGVKLSDWKKRIANHEDATTNLQADKMTVTHVDGLMVRKTKITGQPPSYRMTAGFIRSDFDPPSGAPSGLDASEAQRDASSMFYKRAKSAMTQLQSGVVVGELKQTLGMIFGRGQRMQNLLHAWRNRLKRRRQGGEKAVHKQIADAWLELQFGWKPLAMDINGALAALADSRVETRSVSGSGSGESTVVLQHPITVGSGNLFYRYSGMQTRSTRVKIRGGVKVLAPGHGRNLQKFGLTPNDFVPTVYELIPWSFLVDYFTDLGGTINALSFPREALYYASTAVIKEIKNSWAISGMTQYTSGEVLYEEFIPQITEWRRRVVTRTRGIPAVPAPTVRIPKHLTQWANLAALWVSRDLRGFKYLR